MGVNNVYKGPRWGRFCESARKGKTCNSCYTDQITVWTLVVMNISEKRPFDISMVHAMFETDLY